MKILAGIVVFNPDIKRLEENIAAVNNQVDKVVLFNNGSQNIADVAKLIKNYQGIEIIDCSVNKGIAYALSSIMKYAIANSYDWVLSLDQDSVLMPNLVDHYKKFFDLDDVGALTCNIVDRNFQSLSISDDEVHEVKTCITSAMIIRTEAYLMTDGYDVGMFIDGVDFDICLNLRKKGFKLYSINFDGVLHEVGHGRNVKLLGKKYIVYNENAFRHYYMARNSIYLSRKYPEEISLCHVLLAQLIRLVLILLYEKDKKRKLKNRVRGIMDGYKML